jgi:hypothetical protein
VLVRIGFLDLDPRLLPDMGVKVTFHRPPEGAATASTQPVTLVPKTAVRSEAGASVVFVVRGDVVERRAIQTGPADGDRLEVRAGLQAGDRVVVAPPETLRDGMRIAATGS